MIGDCGEGWCDDEDGGVKGKGLMLPVFVFVIVVGVCVGSNPHISHRTCAPARAYVHVGHGADVGVCVVCVVVTPHTLERLLPTSGGGSTGSSSISDIASKAFVERDVGEEGDGGAWEDEGGGFFFLFLSFLYIRVGLI